MFARPKENGAKAVDVFPPFLPARPNHPNTVGVKVGAKGSDMARQINRLNARSVQTIRTKGRHADGGGLYLVVDRNVAKRWVFLYRDRRTHKLREMGFGGLASVPLAKAREKAAEARAHLAAGRDPLAARRASESDDAEEGRSFGAVADALIGSMEPSWKNPKHRAQWKMTLGVYCKPLRDLPVDQITTEDVLAVLQPMWLTVPETASRVRGRIEKVIDAARARGLRQAENPARWRGHLANLLPPRGRLTRGHHAAMPFVEVPAFVGELRQRSGIAPLALEFLILTAARTGEVIGATWPEIDLEAKLWTVPAERMKAKREHLVPLSATMHRDPSRASKARQSPVCLPGSRSRCASLVDGLRSGASPNGNRGRHPARLPFEFSRLVRRADAISP